jgi:hypothetical protein
MVTIFPPLVARITWAVSGGLNHQAPATAVG